MEDFALSMEMHLFMEQDEKVLTLECQKIMHVRLIHRIPEACQRIINSISEI